MNVGRDIPEELRRAVLMEAGYKCAIPTCRQTPVEIAHIDPWEKVQEHTFDNLIALCPNCHNRYDKKHEIDKKAIKKYKENLALINQRFSNNSIDDSNFSSDQGSYIILDPRSFDLFGIWDKVF